MFSQEVNVEDETTVHGGQLKLMETEFSSSGHGKYSGMVYVHKIFFI